MYFPPPFTPSPPGIQSLLLSSTGIIPRVWTARVIVTHSVCCSVWTLWRTSRGLPSFPVPGREGRQPSLKVATAFWFQRWPGSHTQIPTGSWSETESHPRVCSSPKPNVVPTWCLGNNPTLGHFQVVSVMSISNPTGMPKWGFVRLSIVSQPCTSERLAPFYLQNKVKLRVPAQMKRSRFSFMFAKDVREALRKRLETAASQTLPFSINSL